MTKGRDSGWLATLAIGLATLVLYCTNLERLPDADELYHILAAQGLLETGEPSIGEDGRYWRGYPTTWLVAQSFALFGESLTTARLPSVLFMTALVVALFTFLRREVSPTAAWIGAGLFAVSPFALAVAQFVRFYSLQGLLFFLAAWLVYHQLSRSRSLKCDGLLAILVSAILIFAIYLQPTTVIGIGGLGLWAGGSLLLPWLFDPRVPTRDKKLVMAGLIAAGLVALLLAWMIGLFERLWDYYRTVMLFNELQKDNFLFYHIWYTLYYPTLWTISGLIAVCALINRPRPTAFALVIFLTAVLVSSFAAAKSLRYLFYAQPFLFMLWGIGLAYLFQAGRGLFVRLRDDLALAFSWLPGGWSKGMAQTFLVLAFLSVVLVNPAWLRSVTMLAEIAIPPQPPREDWAAAAAALEPWLEKAEVVVTTQELSPLYYYGRADILLSASKFAEIPEEDRRPFVPDFRSDVPVIADVASLELVLDCHATGLFITLTKWWGASTFEPEATMRDMAVENFIEAHTESLEVSTQSRLRAFTWDHGEAFKRSAECVELPTVAELSAETE